MSKENLKKLRSFHRDGPWRIYEYCSSYHNNSALSSLDIFFDQSPRIRCDGTSLYHIFWFLRAASGRETIITIIHFWTRVFCIVLIFKLWVIPDDARSMLHTSISYQQLILCLIDATRRIGHSSVDMFVCKSRLPLFFHCSSRFLSAMEYHSDANYNSRRVDVVVVVVHTFKNGLTFERLDRFASYLEGSCIRVSRFAAYAYVMIRPTQPAQPAYQPKSEKRA